MPIKLAKGLAVRLIGRTDVAAREEWVQIVVSTTVWNFAAKKMANIDSECRAFESLYVEADK